MQDDTEITRPSLEDEQLLNSVIEDSPSVVLLRRHKIRLHWLKRITIRKYSDIMARKGNDDKVTCQAAAAIVLNNYWRIKLFWGILWRWFYYVREYDDAELLPLLSEAQKKTPVRDYWTATMLLTATRDTMMQMTKAEAASILHEQTTGRDGK